ncbi:hypothetical protein NV36_14365 [Dokdonia donghaensis DSW-1]|uniref:Uncharacterized protein n=1 Tax=Dokdonia donghaensis DSW-1 TaxID=1300343 RepID=A0A0A2GSX1_9FLAO|nr:hypothetical protein NV36_14365 [Dokdonia donghaensis DSW-1]
MTKYATAFCEAYFVVNCEPLGQSAATVLYMARGVQISVPVAIGISVEHEPNFLILLFIFLLEIVKFKNLATFQKYPNISVSNDLRYFLYTLLPTVILAQSFR